MCQDSHGPCPLVARTPDHGAELGSNTDYTRRYTEAIKKECVKFCDRKRRPAWHGAVFIWLHRLELGVDVLLLGVCFEKCILGRGNVHAKA